MINSRRLPSLDGLRAVSILLVMTSHLYWSKSLPALGFLWRFQLGDLGVRVFFVISGFLITHLLLNEFEQQGRISLKDFYIRRVLRIFPAYYAFLAFVAVGSALGYLSVGGADLVRAALYVSNYFDRSAPLAHTWSLSVEEQFYMIWPGVLVLAGIRRGILIACLFAVASAALRAAASFPLSPDTNVFWVRFETAADAIAIGCVFAAFRQRLGNLAVYRAACSPVATTACVVAVFALASSHRWPWFWNAFGITLMNLLIVLTIDGCIRARGSWHFKLLNSWPLVKLGVLSYSIYLWQQLFLTSVWKVDFPLSVGLAVLAGAISYYVVELPILRLKESLWPGNSAPRGQSG